MPRWCTAGTQTPKSYLPFLLGSSLSKEMLPKNLLSMFLDDMNIITKYYPDICPQVGLQHHIVFSVITKYYLTSNDDVFIFLVSTRNCHPVHVRFIYFLQFSTLLSSLASHPLCSFPLLSPTQLSQDVKHGTHAERWLDLKWRLPELHDFGETVKYMAGDYSGVWE